MLHSLSYLLEDEEKEMVEKAFLSQSLVAFAILPLLVQDLIRILFHALLPVPELVTVATRSSSFYSRLSSDIFFRRWR